MNGGGFPRGSVRPAPPPPSEPAPPNQPRIPMGGFRLPMMNQGSMRGPPGPSSLKTNGTLNHAQMRNGRGNDSLGSNGTQHHMPEVLKSVPDAGAAGVKRSSINSNKPAPGAGRPKPKPKPVITLPKCRALYDYDAKDIDELALKEGDIVDIVLERKYNN